MNLDPTVKRCDRVKAIYAPHRTDTLKPGCKDFIGKGGIFAADYLMGQDDKFPGEFAMGIPFRNDEWKDFPAGWVPQRDLKILEVVQ